MVLNDVFKSCIFYTHFPSCEVTLAVLTTSTIAKNSSYISLHLRNNFVGHRLGYLLTVQFLVTYLE